MRSFGRCVINTSNLFKYSFRLVYFSIVASSLYYVIGTHRHFVILVRRWYRYISRGHLWYVDLVTELRVQTYESRVLSSHHSPFQIIPCVQMINQQCSYCRCVRLIHWVFVAVAYIQHARVVISDTAVKNESVYKPCSESAVPLPGLPVRLSVVS